MSADDWDHPTLKSEHILDFNERSVVLAIDEHKVFKRFYQPGIERECLALDRLNPHPNIVNKLAVKKNGIVLERGKPLREILKTPSNLSTAERIGYAKQAAEGLKHIHENGIVHTGIGPHNMIVIGERLVYINFESCAMDKEDRDGTVYEWCSYRPLPDSEGFQQVNAITDIFAYGCAVYEFMTGHQPHYDLSSYVDRARRAEDRWEAADYPDATDLPLEDIMLGCWTRRFQTMNEVIKALPLQTVS